MDQLAIPLQRLPQFDMQSATFSDSSPNSDPIDNASSSAIWNSDGLSGVGIPALNNSNTAPTSLGSLGSTFGLGSIGTIVQQLVALLQQLLQMLSGNGLSQTGYGSGTNPEDYFNQANGTSQGDPHLSFSGVDGNNHFETSRFDSMTDHPNLLDSNSFPGGYQLSTKVGAPLANGATLNQRATIATNFGRTQVSMNGDGSVSISRCGKQESIGNGQTLDLGHGESVTKNNDGSLTITNQNSQGGRITTTLKPNSAGGVDVAADANGVNLGGDLVTEAEGGGSFDLQNLDRSYDPRPRNWFGPTI
ncbi:MAG: hypothetical protein JOZ59_06785 [Candidatus Eremiobacteraeota bacterium]|nr:hypothetical protein [Candidatus Eremiobacteraeota bacterium]